MNTLYSPQEDNSVINIQDVVSTNGMLKVYPYEMINTSKAKTFIKNNSTSIISISQDNIQNIEQDENGNKYFEVAHSIKDNITLDISSQSSIMGKELKIEEELVCLSNAFYDTKLENIKIGAATLLPAVFTIGKPYDYNEFLNGNQQLFVATPAIEAKNSTTYITNNIDPNGLYEFTLTNISVIENQYTNSRLLFNKQFGTSKYEVQVGTETKNGIAIELESTSLVNRIFAKGKVENIDTDIDLKVSEKLTPIKFTPISFNEKLAMFADWFDYDVVLPLFIAEKFAQTGGLTLEQLKDVEIKQGVKYFNENEVLLIKDMLAVSCAFATSFGQFKRITSGSDTGKLDPSQTIGSSNLKLSAMEDKDPVKVIDGLFETYIRTNFGTEDREQLRAVKAIICALSRYIYSSYAIGKGQNAFNEIYLPWFLRPLKEITLTETNNAWNIADGITFNLNSRYFDISAGKISQKENVDISKLKLIQTDRKLTIPFVGETIQEINKLPLPGDINTASSNDLQYLFYTPIKTSATFQKLFLNDPVITEDNSDVEKTFNTNFTAFGTLLPTAQNEIQQFIKNDYAKQFTIPASNVNPKYTGNIEPLESPNIFIGSKSETKQTGFQTDVLSAIENLNDGFLKSFFKWALNNGLIQVGLNPTYHQPTVEQTKQFLSEYLNVNINTIVVSKAITYEIYIVIQGKIRLSTSAIDYKLISQRFAGVIVSVSGRSTSVSINRDTLFDKVSWNFFVKDYLGIGGFVRYNLLEQNNLPIQAINEIVLSQVWGNTAKIYLGASVIEVPLFNKDDESIGIQRIILS